MCRLRSGRPNLTKFESSCIILVGTLGISADTQKGVMNRQFRTPRAPSRPHWLESLEPRLCLAAVVVTTEADSGAGSLRAAIQASNLSSEADTITFAPSV